MQRPGDLDKLLLGDGQGANRRVGGERRAQAFQHCAASLAHGRTVYAPATARLHAKVDVLGHRQVRRQRQLLVDDGDAMLLGGDGVGDGDGLAVNQQRAAGVGLIGAGQDFHER